MPWILLLLISLFSAPSLAVAIPGVTTGATATQQNTPPPEPDAEQKKAAYSALADVLENDTSRQELIDQLRKVAATPPQDPVPAIAPPEAEEEKTVLENVTDISRRYGEALSSRFAQLYRNLVGTSHKPFNPHTFSAAATQFSILAAAVFIFYWLLRLSVWPLYRKMGHWGRKKNQHKSSWLHLPAMITGAFVIDLLLLALTLFVGQMLADRLNTGNKTIAFQQGLFLNAFALIEF